MAAGSSSSAGQFSHRRDLFTTADGQPVTFSMRPCPERAALQEAIIFGGGRITKDYSKVHIRLAPPKTITQNANTLSCEYVNQCIRANKMLDQMKFLLSREVQQDSDSDAANTEETSRRAITIKSARRTDYRLADELWIIDYVMKNNAFKAIAGKAMWQAAERALKKEKNLTHRTWQSLKERFRKKILPSIRSFRLPPQALKKFLGESDGSESSSDGEADEPLRRCRTGTSAVSPKLMYSKAEDMDILKWIIKHNKITETKGNQIYREMSMRKIVARTFHSIRNRFLRHIAPNLKKYKIDDRAKDNIIDFLGLSPLAPRRSRQSSMSCEIDEDDSNIVSSSNSVGQSTGGQQERHNDPSAYDPGEGPSCGRRRVAVKSTSGRAVVTEGMDQSSTDEYEDPVNDQRPPARRRRNTQKRKFSDDGGSPDHQDLSDGLMVLGIPRKRKPLGLDAWLSDSSTDEESVTTAVKADSKKKQAAPKVVHQKSPPPLHVAPRRIRRLAVLEQSNEIILRTPNAHQGVTAEESALAIDSDIIAPSDNDVVAETVGVTTEDAEPRTVSLPQPRSVREENQVSRIGISNNCASPNRDVSQRLQSDTTGETTTQVSLSVALTPAEENVAAICHIFGGSPGLADAEVVPSLPPVATNIMPTTMSCLANPVVIKQERPPTPNPDWSQGPFLLLASQTTQEDLIQHSQVQGAVNNVGPEVAKTPFRDTTSQLSSSQWNSPGSQAFQCDSLSETLQDGGERSRWHPDTASPSTSVSHNLPDAFKKSPIVESCRRRTVRSLAFAGGSLVPAAESSSASRSVINTENEMALYKMYQRCHSPTADVTGRTCDRSSPVSAPPSSSVGTNTSPVHRNRRTAAAGNPSLDNDEVIDGTHHSPSQDLGSQLSSLPASYVDEADQDGDAASVDQLAMRIWRSDASALAGELLAPAGNDPSQLDEHPGRLAHNIPAAVSSASAGAATCSDTCSLSSSGDSFYMGEASGSNIQESSDHNYVQRSMLPEVVADSDDTEAYISVNGDCLERDLQLDKYLRNVRDASGSLSQRSQVSERVCGICCNHIQVTPASPMQSQADGEFGSEELRAEIIRICESTKAKTLCAEDAKTAIKRLGERLGLSCSQVVNMLSCGPQIIERAQMTDETRPTFS